MSRTYVSSIAWISAMVISTGSGPGGGGGVFGVAETSGILSSRVRSSVDVDPHGSSCVGVTVVGMMSCSCILLICNKSVVFTDDACLFFSAS